MVETLEPIKYLWYEILKVLIVTSGVTYLALLIVCLFPPGRKGLQGMSTQLELAVIGSAIAMRAIAIAKRFLPV